MSQTTKIKVITDYHPKEKAFKMKVAFAFMALFSFTYGKSYENFQ
jgi:hypothetical protein